jgi:hypothetical protein
VHCNGLSIPVLTDHHTDVESLTLEAVDEPPLDEFGFHEGWSHFSFDLDSLRLNYDFIIHPPLFLWELLRQPSLSSLQIDGQARYLDEMLEDLAAPQIVNLKIGPTGIQEMEELDAFLSRCTSLKHLTVNAGDESCVRQLARPLESLTLFMFYPEDIPSLLNVLVSSGGMRGLQCLTVDLARDDPVGDVRRSRSWREVVRLCRRLGIQLFLQDNGSVYEVKVSSNHSSPFHHD